MKLRSLSELRADLWVFDCDGVIYDNAKKAERKVARLMLKFIVSRYGCRIEEASEIRRELLKKHNVQHSIMALTREGFDEQEILRETYFLVDLQGIGVVFSNQLQKFFSSLPGKKIILTNNHGGYVRRVLDSIGISAYFSFVFGSGELGHIQKPDQQAFQFMQEAMHAEKNIVFVDDEIQNVVVAEKFGWTAVLKGGSKDYAGFSLPKLR